MTRLRLKRLQDGNFWIFGLEPPHGPYTKAEREEAKSDMDGLTRFYEQWDGMNEMPLFSRSDK